MIPCSESMRVVISRTVTCKLRITCTWLHPMTTALSGDALLCAACAADTFRADGGTMLAHLAIKGSAIKGSESLIADQGVRVLDRSQ